MEVPHEVIVMAAVEDMAAVTAEGVVVDMEMTVEEVIDEEVVDMVVTVEETADEAASKLSQP